MAEDNWGDLKSKYGDQQKPPDKPSNLWYLLPIFFTWIGGLIGYFALKDRDKKMAEKILIIGIVMTVVLGLIVSLVPALILSYFASELVSGQTEQLSSQKADSITCVYGNMQVDGCSYDTDTGDVTLIVDNTGTIIIEEMSVVANYPGGNEETFEMEGSLDSGQVGEFKVGPLSSGWDNLELRTQCESVSRKFSC